MSRGVRRRPAEGNAYTMTTPAPPDDPRRVNAAVMTSPDLPAELKAALESRLHGLSLSETARRANTISQTYRAGGGSGDIRSDADALAYALARMPATYAAVTAS